MENNGVRILVKVIGFIAGIITAVAIELFVIMLTGNI